MTQKEFETMQAPEWFCSIHEDKKYLITASSANGHYVDEHDERMQRTSSTFIPFEMHHHYSFIEQKGDIEHPEPEKPKEITCTAKEALDKGLQIGDKITLECTFNGDYDEYLIGVIIERDGKPYDSKLSKSYTINFTPSEKPYIPAHNETCVIKTKNGFATKALAIHYKDKISAVSIDKHGNTDYHFKAEQIEKFFPLPPE